MLCCTSSEPIKPDIVSSGSAGWVALEITTSGKPKEDQLSAYASIDPRGLSTYGLQIHSTKPDIICSRLDPIQDGPFCQLILRDSLQFQDESCIKNERLRSALLEANGMELYKLPSISITIVPEMASKSGELRRGIYNIVMQLFDEKCDGKTVEQIAQEGLDKIANCVSITDRKGLEKSIRTQMDVLVKKYLPEYIEFDEEGGVYKTKDKKALRPNTMGLINRKLKEWSAEPSVIKPLTEFPDKKEDKTSHDSSR